MSNNGIINKYNNTPNNSCWLWSSLRIANAYAKYKKIPDELHNDIIKRYINNNCVNIIRYDKDTIKDADISNDLCGNAVEYLTVNGFYYNYCIPVKKHNTNLEYVKLTNYESIFAILIQTQGHYECIIKENDIYYRYNQSNANNCVKTKINITNNMLYIGVNSIYTNLYVYVDKI